MKTDLKLQGWEKSLSDIKEEITVEIRSILEDNKKAGNQLVTFRGIPNAVIGAATIGKLNKGKFEADELLAIYKKLAPYANPKKKK